MKSTFYLDFQLFVWKNRKGVVGLLWK